MRSPEHRGQSKLESTPLLQEEDDEDDGYAALHSRQGRISWSREGVWAPETPSTPVRQRSPPVEKVQAVPDWLAGLFEGGALRLSEVMIVTVAVLSTAVILLNIWSVLARATVSSDGTPGG